MAASADVWTLYLVSEGSIRLQAREPSADALDTDFDIISGVTGDFPLTVSIGATSGFVASPPGSTYTVPVTLAGVSGFTPKGFLNMSHSISLAGTSGLTVIPNNQISVTLSLAGVSGFTPDSRLTIIGTVSLNGVTGFLALFQSSATVGLQLMLVVPTTEITMEAFSAITITTEILPSTGMTLEVDVA